MGPVSLGAAGVIARSLTRKTFLAHPTEAAAGWPEKSVTGVAPAKQRGFARWRGFWGDDRSEAWR
jgi:hypothetical protein